MFIPQVTRIHEHRLALGVLCKTRIYPSKCKCCKQNRILYVIQNEIAVVAKAANGSISDSNYDTLQICLFRWIFLFWPVANIKISWSIKTLLTNWFTAPLWQRWKKYGEFSFFIVRSHFLLYSFLSFSISISLSLSFCIHRTEYIKYTYMVCYWENDL